MQEISVPALNRGMSASGLHDSGSDEAFQSCATGAPGRVLHFLPARKEPLRADIHAKHKPQRRRSCRTEEEAGNRRLWELLPWCRSQRRWALLEVGDESQDERDDKENKQCLAPEIISGVLS